MTVFNKRMRITAVILTTTFLLLFALGVLSVHAQTGYSNVTISNNPTANVASTIVGDDLIFSPTADDANLNAADLIAGLAQVAGDGSLYDVVVNTIYASGTQTGILTVADPISNSNLSNLVLNGGNELAILADITHVRPLNMTTNGALRVTSVVSVTDGSILIETYGAAPGSYDGVYLQGAGSALRADQSLNITARPGPAGGDA